MSGALDLDQLHARDRREQRARLVAHALGLTQVAGVLVGDPAAAPAASARPPGPSSASSSVTSRTDAEKRRASSVPSSSPYSFIAEPQPAAVTTTRS